MFVKPEGRLVHIKLSLGFFVIRSNLEIVISSFILTFYIFNKIPMLIFIFQLGHNGGFGKAKLPNFHNQRYCDTWSISRKRQ